MKIIELTLWAVVDCDDVQLEDLCDSIEETLGEHYPQVVAVEEYAVKELHDPVVLHLIKGGK